MCKRVEVPYLRLHNTQVGMCLTSEGRAKLEITMWDGFRAEMARSILSFSADTGCTIAVLSLFSFFLSSAPLREQTQHVSWQRII